MCDIIVLPPKKNIPFKLLQMVVWNNPHGYGLIVDKGKKGLEVIKKFNEEGTDPKEVDELMRVNDKYNRYLHLRWATEGDKSLDNAHPYLVYDDGVNQVYFMHNGTLHEYKPKQGDTRSDSKIFADTVLRPILEFSKGNYTDEVTKMIISKFWGISFNRGLIVSTNQVPLFLNLSDWKEITTKDEEGNELKFRSSNDTYFETLTRGFVFERIKAEEEERKKKLAEEEARKQNILPFPSSKDNYRPVWPLTKLKDIVLKPSESVTAKLSEVFQDNDIWTDEGLASLENVTEIEFDSFCVANPHDAAGLLVYLTSCYARVLVERDTTLDKHIRASKMIADQKIKIDLLENQVEKLANLIPSVQGKVG